MTYQALLDEGASRTFHAGTTWYSAADVGAAAGLKAAEVERVYALIDSRGAATRYLRRPPILLDETLPRRGSMSVRIVRFLLWLYLLSEAQTNLVISGIVQDQSGAAFLEAEVDVVQDGTERPGNDCTNLSGGHHVVPAQPQCFLGNPIGRPSDFVDVYK